MFNHIDVIIVEDDPYFFLQCGEYENPNLRPQAIDGQEKASSQEFIDNLVPSFLRFVQSCSFGAIVS